MTVRFDEVPFQVQPHFNGARALADYCRIIQEEAQKRGSRTGQDPLAAAQEKYKNKKGYGGK